MNIHAITADGYTPAELDESGRLISINKSTGERTEMIGCIVPIGTKSYTPEQQEERRKRFETIKYRTNDPDGNWFWIHALETFSGLKPETIVRLLFLLTYADYKNILRKSERGEPIKKVELPKLLKLSDSSFFRFWREVNNRFLIQNADGNISIISESIFRGKMKIGEHFDNFDFFKVYRRGIRQLYMSCKASSHKRLGYIFQLLPYINREYNILCRNPLETDIDLVQPMSFSELCNRIGYDPSNRHRLLKEYQKILFTIDNHDETLVRIVTTDRDNIENGQVILNPKIIYGGSDPSKTDIYKLFYRN